MIGRQAIVRPRQINEYCKRQINVELAGVESGGNPAKNFRVRSQTEDTVLEFLHRILICFVVICKSGNEEPFANYSSSQSVYICSIGIM